MKITKGWFSTSIEFSVSDMEYLTGNSDHVLVDKILSWLYRWF